MSKSQPAIDKFKEFVKKEKEICDKAIKSVQNTDGTKWYNLEINDPETYFKRTAFDTAYREIQGPPSKIAVKLSGDRVACQERCYRIRQFRRLDFWVQAKVRTEILREALESQLKFYSKEATE